MLRRAPTAITLTSDDVAAYEDSRLARLAANSSLNQRTNNGTSAVGLSGSPLENTSGPSSRKGTPADPSDELKPLPGDRIRAVQYAATADASRTDGRSRDERIGVAR